MFSKLPRRAVIVDGVINEKKDYPSSVEIETISKLFEEERERRGEKIVPRFTTQLMEKAISTNDIDFWEAINNDIDTGDFDTPSVAALFSQNETLPVMFITCLVTSKDINNFMLVLRVFYAIQKDFTDDIKENISKTITCQSKSFMDVIIRFVPYVKRDLRDGVLEELSKFVNITDVGIDAVTEMLTTVVAMKKFEVLKIFTNVDTTRCFDNTKLFETLVSKIKTTSATQKHYILTFVAKAIKEIPSLADDYEQQLKDVVTQTLTSNITYGYSDTRTVAAIGYIAEKVFEDPVVRNMATLLLWSVNKS